MGGMNFSPECPECGSSRATVRSAGLDSTGHRLRLRICSNCEAQFQTLEITVPYRFSAVDVVKRERQRTSLPPRRRTDWFQVVRKSATSWMVTLHEGTFATTCRRGLHELEGDNVYLAPSGQRVCKACRKANTKARYRNRMDKMPAPLKDELREYYKRKNDERREYRRDWMRRKRAERRAA